MRDNVKTDETVAKINLISLSLPGVMNNTTVTYFSTFILNFRSSVFSNEMGDGIAVAL